MKYTTTKRTKDCLHKISASNSENNRRNAKKSKEIQTSYSISLESEAYTKIAVTNSELHSHIASTFAGVRDELASSGSARLLHTRPHGVWTNVWQVRSFKLACRKA